MPVTVKTRKGELVVDTDEHPPKANQDKIPTLRTAYRSDGTVTVANSSSISDGAAALTLMSQTEADNRNIKPLAIIQGHSSFAHEPAWFTTAPVGAIKNLLDKLNWQVDEVDLFEINEAFAVVTMAAMCDLVLDHNNVNVNGGACALGHPIGAVRVYS
jgi:acetyl-CoA C-acetyltransferase